MLPRYARQFMAVAIVAYLSFGAKELAAQDPSNKLGIFEGQTDVGNVTPPGTLAYDTGKGVYTIASAGENLWSTVDAFHFVWKKVSGDAALTAEMNFPESTGNPNPHRKTVLMFRQTLDADGVYADAAQHGSGLMGLQYRQIRGATTQDIELNMEAAPRRVRLEKRGDTITMFLSIGANRCTRWARRSSCISTGHSTRESGFARTTRTWWRRRRFTCRADSSRGAGRFGQNVSLQHFADDRD